MKAGSAARALLAAAALSGHVTAAGSTAPSHGAAVSRAPRAASTPPDPEIARASEAFRRGSELAKTGDWEGALAAYEESASIKAHPLTTYDIAFCERALGRYVRASLHFEEVLSSAATFSLPRDLMNDAGRCLEEVRARIVHVSIARHPEDLAVKVDGLPLERAKASGDPVYIVGTQTTVTELPRGNLELLVDPGTHVFVGSGPAEARVVESASYAAGQQAVVTLSLPQHTKPVSPPASPRLREDTPVPAYKPNHTAAYIAFGIGGAGLVSAAVFSGLSLAEKHSLDSSGKCMGQLCPPEYADRESRMRTFADVATVSIATFAAGAAVGTYLLLTASPPKAGSASITPWFAGQSGGVSGRF
jgi:hypothetical protein